MKMLYLSHDAYWYYLANIEESYDIKGDFFNCPGEFAPKRAQFHNEYDYMLFFSTEFRNECDIDSLVAQAKIISKMNNNKRVTIGYSYILPEYQRLSQDIFCEVELVSVKGNKVVGDIVRDYPVKPNFKPTDLMEMMVNRHKDLESQKVLKKVLNCLKQRTK